MATEAGPNRSSPGRDVGMSLRRILGEDLGLRRPRPGSTGSIYAAVLVIGAAAAWSLGSHEAPANWPLLASVVLWQPAVEELLFRGFLQGVLLRTHAGARDLAGISVANLATTVAFVMMHLVNHPPAWAFGVLFPSLLFGFYRDQSGSTWPPMALHVVLNGAFFAPAIGLS